MEPPKVSFNSSQLEKYFRSLDVETHELVVHARDSKLFRIIKKGSDEPMIAKVSKLTHRSKREIEALSRVSHPNIISFQGSHCFESITICIMEQARGGDLCDLLLSKGAVQEKLAKNIYKQIVSAVSYLHSLKVAHRDLKLENFVLMEPVNTVAELKTARVKLVDFEFSTQWVKSKVRNDRVGTLQYHSPEIMRQEYDPLAADVWAVGVIFYAMVTAHFPFSKTSLESNRTIPSIPETLTDDFRVLLLRIFTPENQRPTIMEIAKDRWFQQSIERQILQSIKSVRGPRSLCKSC